MGSRFPGLNPGSQSRSTTLYGTVTSEVELVNWAENITVEKEKEKTLDQYSNKMGKALK